MKRSWTGLSFVLWGVIACGGAEGDPCADVRCENGGVVAAAEDACGCDCSTAPGWEGPTCQEKIAARLAGTYASTGTWTSTDGTSGDWDSPDGTILSESMFFADRVELILGGNPGNGEELPYGCTATAPLYSARFAIYAEFDGAGLTIPSQLADNMLTVEGTGTLDGSAMTLSFEGSAEPLGACTTTYDVALTKN